MPAAQLSVAEQRGDDPARDFLVGSTYRKDVLRGALWKMLRDQLAGAPAEKPGPTASPTLETRDGQAIGLGAPFGWSRSPGFDPSALDSRAALSTILAYSFGVLRWEPLNPNPEHRACPSPGSRFTVDASLFFESRHGASCYRYLVREHALFAMADSTGAARASQDALRISLTCDPARCASPYGDLAYCLSAIELGANLSQFLLILGLFGLRLDDVRLHAADRADDRAVVPGLSASIAAPEIAGWLRQAWPERRVFAAREYPPIERGAFPLLDAVIDNAANAAEAPPFPGGLAAGPWRGNPIELLRASAARSSGLDLQAPPSVNRAPGGSRTVQLLDKVAELRGSFTGVARHRVHAHVTLPQHLRVAIRDCRRSADNATLSLGKSTGGRGSGGDDVYPPDAIVVTLSADYPAYVARFGELALFHMYLAAGIDAQSFCLAAATVGLACRPMRSFDHAAADAALPIDYWSTLQLVIYADDAVNPAFPIGGAPWEACG